MLRIVGLSRTCGFDILCRDTAPDFMWTDLRVLQYQRTSSHDGALAYFSKIKKAPNCSVTCGSKRKFAEVNASLVLNFGD